ncbi:MAG: hypothetical protein KAS65_03980, partial [Candidatus Aminicenantes bacterium]|nr:hypothetical protein [Candidatus Aminicenantes bacterium]
MKYSIIFFLIIFPVLLTCHNFNSEDNWPVLKGPYLGQKLPGMVPQKFAVGFISTEQYELGSVFS